MLGHAVSRDLEHGSLRTPLFRSKVFGRLEVPYVFFRTLARPGARVVRGVFLFFIAQLKNSLPNFNVGLTAPISRSK
ncbi:hypothetical protein V4C53_47470, partial [Paraburkholderia azotifigens]